MYQYTNNYQTYQQARSTANKYAPDVMDALRPCAERMIEVRRYDEMRPKYGPVNESREYRLAKARCVHRLPVEDTTYRGIVTLKRYIRPMQDGSYRCELCKAKILTKFDKNMIDALDSAIEVLDTLIAFGPDMSLANYDPRHPEERGYIDRMIDCKEFLNIHAKKITNTFIEIAKSENASEDNERHLGEEYADHTQGSITSFI